MATLPVKFFFSTMQGVPAVTPDRASLLNMLDAVLVNGFNVQAVASMSYAAGFITINTSAPHGFIEDQVVSVYDVDQPEYAGEWRVASLLSATSLQCAVPDGVSLPASASGAAMKVKAAPLGWEIAFTGTNKRAYRSTSPYSNKPFLRVDCSLGAWWTSTYGYGARVTAAQGMTDIDTFVGARAPFDAATPTRNEGGSGSGTTAIDGWMKWWVALAAVSASQVAAPGAGSRDWIVTGDDRAFYLFNHAHSPQNLVYGRSTAAFGDFDSFKQGDAFNCMLIGSEYIWPANAGMYPGYGCDFGRVFNNQGLYLLRDHTQVGPPTRFHNFSLQFVNAANAISGNTDSWGIPMPNGPDFGVWMAPFYIKEERRNDVRGIMPGVFFLPQYAPYPEKTIVGNVVTHPGRKFLFVNLSHSSASGAAIPMIAVDITGPWRQTP